MENIAISTDVLQLLTQHQLAIRGYIRGSIGNAFDADDVFQKTNIIICQKSQDWNREIPFLKWAFSIARYEVMGFYRDKAREKLVFDDSILELMLQDSEELASELSDRAQWIKQCLQQVSQENRYILACKYISRNSAAEIGKQVNRSVDGVKGLLKRIRQKLRGCVDQKLKTSL